MFESQRGLRREHLAGCVSGGGFSPTIIHIVAVFATRLMKVIKGKKSPANRKPEDMKSTEIGDLGAMRRGPQPVVMNEQITAELSTATRNMDYYAFSQGFDVLGVVPGGKIFQSGQSE